MCGKGTYVRAFARDLGIALGCFGHVIDLRRTFVEPFEERDAVTLDTLLALEGDLDGLDNLLISPLDAMGGLLKVRLAEDEARRVRLGNSIILRGRDAPIEEVDVCAVYDNSLVAIGNIEKGQFKPQTGSGCIAGCMERPGTAQVSVIFFKENTYTGVAL